MLTNKQFLTLAGSILRGSSFLERCSVKDVGIGRHRDDSAEIWTMQELFMNVHTNYFH